MEFITLNGSAASVTTALNNQLGSYELFIYEFYYSNGSYKLHVAREPLTITRPNNGDYAIFSDTELAFAAAFNSYAQTYNVRIVRIKTVDGATHAIVYKQLKV